MATTASAAATPTMVSSLPNEASFRLSGVSSSSSPSKSPAIWPTSVPIPVAVTTPRPRPPVTMDVAKAMVERSPSGAPGATAASASFSEGTDSPVSEASCARRLAESSRRRSAGTMLPSSSSTTSPSTRSRAGRISSAPPRTTRAVGAESDRSASSDDCALRSCTMPITAFTTTMAKMMPASAHSRKSAESTAATTRMSTMGSPSCSRTMAPSVLGGFEASSLGPFWARRRRASASVRPSGEVSSAASTTLVGFACQGVAAASARGEGAAAAAVPSGAAGEGVVRGSIGFLSVALPRAHGSARTGPTIPEALARPPNRHAAVTEPLRARRRPFAGSMR